MSLVCLPMESLLGMYSNLKARILLIEADYDQKNAALPDAGCL